MHAARLDVGISQAALAAVAGISRAYLCEIEAGRAEPSLDVLSALAAVLGRRLTIGFAPDTDPLVRDRHQAPIVEGLLSILHARWRPALEVPVFRPVHGVIDVVLQEQPPRTIVCVEVESAIRRIEATMRWGEQKARALLVSGPITSEGSPPPTVSRVLALPSTRANREIVSTFRASIQATFPADPADVYRALTTADAPWPGAGLLWFAVSGTVARALPRSPLALRRSGS